MRHGVVSAAVDRHFIKDEDISVLSVIGIFLIIIEIVLKIL